MAARQRIIPVRREYNRWVANQTLEDYALRFTAKSARQFSSQRISQTAIGAISFLALEAIGGAITLSYGTTNAFFAIVVASVAMLAIGLPISRYAIRHGVDIDLLTRGASFGYIGSTITSLIYASFTFMLFAIEASIMSGALELTLGIPLWIGYIISAVMVIPLVTHGVRLISRFQLLTQPFWIVLNVLPFIFIALIPTGRNSTSGVPSPASATPPAAGHDRALRPRGVRRRLRRHPGADVADRRTGRLPALPAAGKTDQVAPPPCRLPRRPRLGHHRRAEAAGRLLPRRAVFASGVPVDRAADPAQMYLTAFGYMIPWHNAALLLMAAFVVISQLKINVMNAYAGSLAWSNFFSRLTHSHPGRVIWLVFNVAIALLLMELGIYKLLEETLGIFSIVAMAWLCTISADLFINKPLGLAPPGIEFKRAHLYDINPVGLGAMTLSATIALIAHFGVIGAVAASLAPYITLVIALIASPLIAWARRANSISPASRAIAGRTSRTSPVPSASIPSSRRTWHGARPIRAPICSLCCSLDSRCHDMCKPKARFNAQVGTVAKALLPETVIEKLTTRLGRYGIAVVLALTAVGAILAMIAHQVSSASPGDRRSVNRYDPDRLSSSLPSSPAWSAGSTFWRTIAASWRRKNRRARTRCC
jgi:purine-cytosine permease-like protein